MLDTFEVILANSSVVFGVLFVVENLLGFEGYSYLVLQKRSSVMFMGKHNKGQAEVGNKRKIKWHKISLFYCFEERHEKCTCTKELTDLLYENEFCFYIFSTLLRQF